MSNDPVIRITREEATSSHVDDLIKRQASLRGEPIAKRGRNRAWFYQNWFIFMIVGALGAYVAWTIMERFMHDEIYLQGPLTSIVRLKNPDAAEMEKPQKGMRRLVIPMATVKLRGQEIWIAVGSREQGPDGKSIPLDASSLKEGEEVGLWVRFFNDRRKVESVAQVYATFVVRHPTPQPAGTETSLEVLDSQAGAISMLFFPTVAAFIGLFIGAADGLMCRLFRRALLAGSVGLLVGFVGGLISGILGNLIYGPLSSLAVEQMASTSAGVSSLGFGIQVLGRSIAWGLCGMAMGLGQGLALRSSRLVIYGLIGGVVGGLLGGLMFDPIDQVLLGLHDRAGGVGARYSRLVGLLVIGASVGGMIGLVELLARDAWLRMVRGPLKGKEFLLFKDVMMIGSSPRSDLYLFNDPLIAPEHAMIRAIGENCDVEARQPTHPVGINGLMVTRARLRHGDNVTIGNTSFVFQRRKG